MKIWEWLILGLIWGAVSVFIDISTDTAFFILFAFLIGYAVGTEETKDDKKKKK